MVHPAHAIGPPLAAPIIQKPDGSYLMGSDLIIDWLEKEYPDRPSCYAPEMPTPIDLRSDEYRQTADLQTADFKVFAQKVDTFYGTAFCLCELTLVKCRAGECDGERERRRAKWTGSNRH